MTLVTALYMTTLIVILLALVIIARAAQKMMRERKRLQEIKEALLRASARAENLRRAFGPPKK